MENKSQQPINLTTSQQNVLDQMKEFVFNSDDRVFILKGYAGTGKTTLMRFLIEELEKKQKHFILIAPTGRAAKILHDITGKEANTIHHLIYSHPSLNKDLSDMKDSDINIEATGQLYLNFERVEIDTEKNPPAVYIVDESSMVADVEKNDVSQAKFGNGKLLTDLVNYDQRPESKYIFIGDPCQLNPINEVKSPALISDYFKENFGLKAQESSLTEIMRQKDGNDLILASHKVRKMWTTAPESENTYPFVHWSSFPVRSCKETHLYGDLEQMVNAYISKVRANGYEDATFISPSNSKCYTISRTVRNALGYTSPIIQKNDLLLVIQNNYPTGLLNGDMVEVISIDSLAEQRVGIDFQRVTVKDIASGAIFSIRLMISTLTSPLVNIDSIQQTRLYLDFAIRMKQKGIDQKHNSEKFYDNMIKDPYLNALRCNYGYAITCHKAQGGEWNNVFVDFGIMAKNLTKSKCQWVYTAITRAKTDLHVLNKPYIQ